VKFLYTWYTRIIHYWPTSLIRYLCSRARCHLPMGLVLPGSQDRVITPAHGVESRDRMLALCPIPLAAAACPNCYGHHSEPERKRLLAFSKPFQVNANGRVWGLIWKLHGAAVAYFQVTPYHLPGESDKNYENTQSAQLISRLRFSRYDAHVFLTTAKHYFAWTGTENSRKNSLK
jgi:hypothetical protein